MSRQSIHKPNFFIVGAPKCGTTSLWEWLRMHPDIFLTREKEPHFFNFDHKNRKCHTLQDYEFLFKKAGPHHQVIGEVSPDYLRSLNAIQSIHDYVIKPKIVVAIRNPVDMTLSWHNHMLFHNHEDEPDFWTAWHLQKRRHYGDRMPNECPDPRLLWYADVCSLGSQLKRLYYQVPSSRIHIIQLESVKINPRFEYRRLLRFLDVEDDGRNTFPVANAGRKREATVWWPVLKRIDGAIRTTGLKLPKFGLMRNLDNKTHMRVDTREAINASQRAELVDYFSDETHLAEQVTGLDLDHWRR